MMADKKMIERREWSEFQAVGLLWWVNRILHLFGWAIVIERDDETDEIAGVYPARCRFRGFSEAVEDEGYLSLTQHMAQRVDELIEDAAIEDNEHGCKTSTGADVAETGTTTAASTEEA